MATTRISKSLVMNYFGSHAVRGLGVATSTSSIAFVIPWMNPQGEIPTITVSGAGITGYSGITATVNTSRTNKDSIGFDLTGGTFTANASYLCYVNFTLS